MEGKQKDLLKSNAKKVSEEPRAFFFLAEPDDTFLHIDRKLNSPKQFGNVKKVSSLLSKLYDIDVSNKAKLCAGLVHREDSGLVFVPTVQKGNVPALQKGLKTYRKEIGSFEVRLPVEEEGSADAPETEAEEEAPPSDATPETEAEEEALADTIARDLEEVAREVEQKQQALRKAQERVDEGVFQLTDRVVDQIAVRLLKGQELGSLEKMIANAPSLVDQLRDALRQQEEARDEVVGSGLQARALQARADLDEREQALRERDEQVDEGVFQLTDRVVDQIAARLIKGQELGSLEKLVSNAPSLVDQLRDALRKQQDARRERDDARIALERSQSDERVHELTQERRRLDARVESLSVDVLDTSLDSVAERLLSGREIDAGALRAALGDLPAKLQGAATERDGAREQLWSAELEQGFLQSVESLAADFRAIQAKVQACLGQLAGELAGDEREQQQARLAELRAQITQRLGQVSSLRPPAPPQSQ